MTSRSGVGLAETAVSALLGGTSFPVIAVAIRGGLDPLEFAFLRFAVAAPVMLIPCLIWRRRLGGLFRMKAIWLIGLFNAVGFLCQFVGQAHTDASVAALLVNLSVMFAALGGAFFLGERLTPSRAAGVALAVLGTVLLTTSGNIGELASGQLFGDGLYLLSALFGAAYIVYSKSKTDETGWDPYAASAVIIASTAVIMFPAALLSGAHPPISALSWQAIIYTALFNTAIPYALYQAGLRYLSAGSSAVVLTLGLVTAVGISVIFLGEAMTPVSWTGAVLILVSVLLVSGLEVGGKSLSVVNSNTSRA
ncbi:MAG: DMT family transporter [Nitrososphaerales archaeon]|nr:DMT family transporter [Nitrososphaerales archaeon]